MKHNDCFAGKIALKSRIFDVLSRLFVCPFFWVGLGVKLAFMFFVQAECIEGLFLPFLSYSAEHGWREAYNVFSQSGLVEAFPYPLVMLGVLLLPFKLALGLGFDGSVALSFVIRMVLLLFDFLILVVLSTWLRRFSVKSVVLLYWLSPVLFYVSYVHGQLDVIPVAMLMASLYFLFQEKLLFSAILLGLAISSKSHIVIALPVVLLYFINNKLGLRQFSLFVLVVLAIPAVTVLAGLDSFGFRQMVLDNSTQARVFVPRINFEGTSYFLILPAIYFVALILPLTFVRINRDLLIVLIAFVFSAITVALIPMPGWYFWFMPFMIYFVLKDRNWFKSYPFLLLMLIQCLALLYWGYGFIDRVGVLPSFGQDIVFTLLQTSMLVQLFLLFDKGLHSDGARFVGFAKPFLVTISGDSGTGKTTLSKGLTSIIGEKNLLLVCGDGMHKWERGDDNWKKHTHLNPKANELHNDYFNFSQLKAGKSIRRRSYDHDTGKFTKDKKIRPKPVIVSEGLHASYLKSMRSIADLKVFLGPSDTIAHNWKIERDVAARGYSKEKILQQIFSRKPDKDKYISVQEKHADVKFELLPRGEEIDLKIVCVNTIYAEYLCDFWKETFDLDVSHEYIDEEHQEILVKGCDLSSSALSEAFSKLLRLDDLFYPHRGEWPAGYMGLMCQFVLFSIFYDNYICLRD